MGNPPKPTRGDTIIRHAHRRLIPYTALVMPWFVIEEVHCAIAGAIERVADGKNDRLMIFMPPRTGKSTMTSVLTPSWWAGRWPSDKIMQLGYKVELPRRFSRQTMGIMRLPVYRRIFPGVQLTRDAHAAGYWRIEDIEEAAAEAEKGEYQAAGVTSGIAGSGFNLGLADDLLSEQDKDSKLAKDRVWEWWGTGFYTRRQPERNAIILTMTRWANDDIAGRLLDDAKKGQGDKWEVLNIPAILDGDTAKKLMIYARNYGWLKKPDHPTAKPEEKIRPLKEGESFSPRRWPTKELRRSKSNMSERNWNALYMGKPLGDEGAILKRNYWRLWKGEPPVCHTILQFYDTAFEAHEKSDFSACTTWGVFEYKSREGRPANHVMLLGRWKRRIVSPDLPKVVIGFAVGTQIWRNVKSSNPQKYSDAAEEANDIIFGDPQREPTAFHPDKILIENKASGQWLWRELRRNRDAKLPVYPWNPPKGDTGSQLGKYARAQKGAFVLEQDCVWYQPFEWAGAVIDECAECHFDGSDESDDLPDTVTMALLYFRQHFLIEFDSDIDEEEEAAAEVEIRALKDRRFYG